mgnify:CR=1 FL=1
MLGGGKIWLNNYNRNVFLDILSICIISLPFLFNIWLFESCFRSLSSYLFISVVHRKNFLY